MRVSPHSLSFLAVLVLAACGGAELPAASATAPPTGAFDSWTKEQKLQHMRTVIQPTMGGLFKAFDGAKYADFGCRTCHGKTMEDPHKALPKLTASGDGLKKLTAEKPEVIKPEIMKFMSEQVTPTMAKAMNEKPYDPATHQGFGCGGCHTVQ